MEYVTAGESHGPAMTAIVTGVPAGLTLDEARINDDLRRRQGGYGRGGRQLIERDRVSVLGGLRFGKTLGTPLCLQVVNDDWANWAERMAPFGPPPADLVREVCPRPGHGDLVGAMRIATDDCRNVLERASARETAARVAVGAVARALLAAFGVEVYSFVIGIGAVALEETDPMAAAAAYSVEAIEASSLRCPDPKTTAAMESAIDEARAAGESLGGTFRVVARGLVPGLGGYGTGRDRLTSQLGSALFSIPAMKGVAFGLGFEASRRPGSQVHDPIELREDGFTRASNNAGGLEAGMTNGQPLIVTAAMKPIPTLAHPLGTVNLDTLAPTEASRERSDVCAVPAAAVVAEAEVAVTLANAYCEAFGDRTMIDSLAAFAHYRERIAAMMDRS